MLYCTLVEENDLSPPREGPRSVETNLQELGSTFGENHGSLVGQAADTLLRREADDHIAVAMSRLASGTIAGRPPAPGGSV